MAAALREALAPKPCLACGEPVDPAEADVTDEGLRCWRCSTRGDVGVLSEQLRARVPEWQRRLMWATVVLFALGSVGVVAVMVVRGDLVWAVLDLPLAVGTLYVLAWREAEGGIVLAGVQGVVLATVGVQQNTVLPLIGVLVAVGIMALGRAALPLQGGDPR